MSVIEIKNCPICSNDQLEPFLTVKDHSISGEEFVLVRCPKCNFAITRDQPSEDQIGRYYDSEAYVSHSDTSKGLINALYHRVRAYMLGRKRKIVEKYIKKGDLLDIGCGTGYFPAHMKAHGWVVRAIEPDEGARKIAMEKFGLKVCDTDVLETLEAGSFDAVTMWHVLEHIHNLNSLLDTIHLSLRSNGIFVIAVPNFTARDASEYGPYWAGYDVPRHLWHFSPTAMERLLNNHNFDLIEIAGMPFDAFYVSMLSERYRKSGLSPLKGGLTGLRSNMHATGRARNASSVIYITKKRALNVK